MWLCELKWIKYLYYSSWYFFLLFLIYIGSKARPVYSVLLRPYSNSLFYRGEGYVVKGQSGVVCRERKKTNEIQEETNETYNQQHLGHLPYWPKNPYDKDKHFIVKPRDPLVVMPSWSLEPDFSPSNMWSQTPSLSSTHPHVSSAKGTRHGWMPGLVPYATTILVQMITRIIAFFQPTFFKVHSWCYSGENNFYSCWC